MRVSADILEAMRERIAPLDTPERRATYLAGEFPRADAVKDLDMRYRWDLYYTSRCSDVVSPSRSVIASSDPDGMTGISDSHIDTALRKVVPTIERG